MDISITYRQGYLGIPRSAIHTTIPATQRCVVIMYHPGTLSQNYPRCGLDTIVPLPYQLVMIGLDRPAIPPTQLLVALYR